MSDKRSLKCTNCVCLGNRFCFEFQICLEFTIAHFEEIMKETFNNFITHYRKKCNKPCKNQRNRLKKKKTLSNLKAFK